MPDTDRVIQRTASVEERVRRDPGGARRARPEGRAMPWTSWATSRRRSGSRRTAPASWRARGSIRRSASACSPTAARRWPSWASRCRSITAISWCSRTRPAAERHLLHALFLHCVHDHRFAAGLVQGSASTARASCANRARCCARWASTSPPKWRSACGIRPPTRATWCCPSGRPAPRAGPRKSSRRSSRAIRMIGVARLQAA